MHFVEYISELFAGTYTLKFIQLFAELFLQLFPYAISGVVIVGLFNAFAPREKLANRLAQKRTAPLLFASLLGAVSPIPTYSLIPMVSSLHRERTVPIELLVAFLISSPLINPLLFFMTYGAFGTSMALMRVAAAVLLGMAGGFLAGVVEKRSGYGALTELVTKADFVATGNNTSWLSRWWGASKKEFKFVFRIFTLSVAIAALTGALVPSDLIERILGGHQTISVAASVALGIPLYACGGGAIPVMQVLYESGLNKGAILAFFISGPGTKLSTISALAVCMPKRISIVYLSVVLAGAFVFGMIYNLF